MLPRLPIIIKELWDALACHRMEYRLEAGIPDSQSTSPQYYFSRVAKGVRIYVLAKPWIAVRAICEAAVGGCPVGAMMAFPDDIP